MNCISSNNSLWIGSNTVNVNKIAKNLSFKELKESELYHNLAQNIVREINSINREQLEEMTPKCAPKLSSKELVKNVFRFPTRKIKKSYSKEVKQMSEMVFKLLKLFLQENSHSNSHSKNFFN